MKNLIIAALIGTCAITATAAETRRVCHDRVVGGKTVTKCKTIKVHRRYQGTRIADAVPDTPKRAVPTAKPKKK